MKSSPLFSLNQSDLLKGLIMAAGGGVVSVIMNSVTKEVWDFNLTALWHGAIVGAMPYIIKNFLTPAQTTAAK